jgi:hypothetical protein
MKKNAIDHQNNEKTERKKISVFQQKKTFMFVSHPQFIKKKMRKLRKYGITRIYVYVVCNCAYFMQSLPKLLFEKKQWKFSPPSFIPFKKSAKKYSLKIIWNGMKNENKIFLNLSQWCSVGHFSKTLLNFKIKSEQKTKKSHPNPPSNHLLRTFKVWKIYILAAISSRFFSKF